MTGRFNTRISFTKNPDLVPSLCVPSGNCTTSETTIDPVPNKPGQRHHIFIAISVGCVIIACAFYSGHMRRAQRQTPILINPMNPDTPTKELFLRLSATDSSTIKRIESDSKHESPFSIDILIVGSQYKTEVAHAQLNTWASHEGVRHIFIATESDDPDQTTCDETMTNDMVEDEVSMKCSQPAPSFPVFAMHPAYYYMKKKNASSWVCEQKRFAMAFTKVVEIYADTQSLPGYLVVADEYTSINLDHISRLLMKRRPPNRVVEVIREDSEFSTRTNPPVVWAGCKSRHHYTSSAYAFGGYGTYFNKKSLKRLIQPLHCDGTGSEFEQDTCAGILEPESNINNAWPIGEENELFESGDSINRMMYKYVRNVETVCLHSDWFIFKACSSTWNVVEW